MTKKKDETSLIPVTTGDALKAAEVQIRGIRKSMSVASAAEIATDEQYEAAGDLLRMIQTAKKGIENERKKVTKLLDAAKKAVMQMFKPLVDELDEGREKIEGSMDAWEELKEAEAEEARERERKKAEAQRKRLQTIANKKIANAGSPEEARQIRADMQASQESALAVGDAKAGMIDGEAPKVGGVASSQVWDFEVIDLTEVPREFLRVEPHVKAILDHAKREEEKGRPPAIPGIEFFKTTRRAVRSF